MLKQKPSYHYVGIVEYHLQAAALLKMLTYAWTRLLPRHPTSKHLCIAMLNRYPEAAQDHDHKIEFQLLVTMYIGKA